MADSSLRWLVFSILVAAATAVSAQNKCSATGQMGGQTFSLTNCEVAYYEGSQGITIWFSSTPITPEERDFFQTSSSADRFRKGRSMVQVAFCPGGGSAVPSPKTAKSVEIGFQARHCAGPGDSGPMGARAGFRQADQDRFAHRRVEARWQGVGQDHWRHRRKEACIQLGPSVRPRAAAAHGGCGPGLLADASANAHRRGLSRLATGVGYALFKSTASPVSRPARPCKSRRAPPAESHPRSRCR